MEGKLGKLFRILKVTDGNYQNLKLNLWNPLAYIFLLILTIFIFYLFIDSWVRKIKLNKRYKCLKIDN